MSEMAKCIVTGGAGFIGSHLVSRLLADGYRVTVVDDFSSGREENLAGLTGHPHLKVERLSILDDRLSSLFSGADVIFHVAAVPRVQYSIRYPEVTNRANIEGTLKVLEAARESGVKRIIYSSSSSIYGGQDRLPLTETMAPNPMSPYALQKLAAETYCRMYHQLFGLETICLRYFNVYGPRQDPHGGYANLIPRSIHLMLRGESPVIFGDGSHTRDFTFVDDVVEANILAFHTKDTAAFGEFMNIGGGRNLSVNEVVSIILQGKSIQPIYQAPVVEPGDTLADIRKAAALIGWKPRVSFEEGIRRAIESFKSE